MLATRSFLPAFALILAGVCAASPARADDFAVRRLQAAGITPDAEGISTYLRSLLPDPRRAQLAAELLNELNCSDFQRRKDASHDLLKMVDPPISALEQAARSENPEVRVRAQRVLQRMDRMAQLSTLLTALDVVRSQPIHGLAEHIADLIVHRKEPPVVHAARQGLLATVQPEDASLLRAGMKSSDADLRAACIPALALACGGSCGPELIALLDDPSERIQLAAAEGLAYLQQQECLPVLIELLESGSFEIRRDSSELLHATTGRRFGYAPHAAIEDRRTRVRQWQEWLHDEGASVTLRRPKLNRRVETGRTLVCVWAEKTLLEIDTAGRTVFSADGFDYLWGCQGLPNGHRLAVDAQAQLVVEYDAAGQECWRCGDLPGRPTSVERLPDGNTLLALSDGHAVVEVSLSGEIVWQVPLPGRPTTAQRLENGNTLVNLQDSGDVVEIDPDGKVVWRIKGLRSAHTAQGLESGNVLVCEMKAGTVAEYDRDGRIVWSKEHFSNPAQAQRLANGNTLVADEQGLHEVDHTGKRVWHLDVSRARFHRY